MHRILIIALVVCFVSAAHSETPSFVQVAPDGTGKKIDQAQITYGGNTVYRQAVSIGDPTTGTSLATVDTAGRLNIGSPNVTSTITNPSITTSTSVVLASNTSRKYALIQNTTSTPAWLAIGTSAVVASGIYLVANGSYEMSSAKGNVDTRAINAISTSSTIAFAVTEGQ